MPCVVDDSKSCYFAVANLITCCADTAEQHDALSSSTQLTAVADDASEVSPSVMSSITTTDATSINATTSSDDTCEEEGHMMPPSSPQLDNTGSSDASVPR